MTRLPSLNLRRPPETKKLMLKEWLFEWELEHILHAPLTAMSRPHTSASYGTEIPFSPLSEEPDPEPGQIRIFSPSIEITRNRPFYAAILNYSFPSSNLLIVPFSRFSVPCIPGELKTDRNNVPLSVLSVWNAMPVTIPLLKKSWVVDKLTHDEMQDCTKLLKWLRSDQELPSGLEEKTGPSIWHPADPRHKYLEEEKLFMEKLQGSSSIEYPSKDIDFPKAADDHTPYGLN